MDKYRYKLPSGHPLKLVDLEHVDEGFNSILKKFYKSVLNNGENYVYIFNYDLTDDVLFLSHGVFYDKIKDEIFYIEKRDNVDVGTSNEGDLKMAIKEYDDASSQRTLIDGTTVNPRRYRRIKLATQSTIDNDNNLTLYSNEEKSEFDLNDMRFNRSNTIFYYEIFDFRSETINYIDTSISEVLDLGVSTHIRYVNVVNDISDDSFTIKMPDYSSRNYNDEVHINNSSGGYNITLEHQYKFDGENYNEELGNGYYIFFLPNNSDEDHKVYKVSI